MTTREKAFRYLGRDDVLLAVATIDLVAVVAEILRLHSEDRVVLTEQAVMRWRTPGRVLNQCHATPAMVDLDTGRAVGLRTIVSGAGNTANGLPPSEGITVLLDDETARPRVLVAAAHISALCAAAVTVIAARTLGRQGMRSLGLIGCGTQARTHLPLLMDALPTLAEVRLFDVDTGRAEAFRELAAASYPDARVVVVPMASQCVTEVDLVVTATTATEGYIPWDWLTEGTLVSTVSIDDLLPEVVQRCDLLVIDDWDLVTDDNRRLLGRMYRAGDLLSPSGIVADQVGGRSLSARTVDATLGEIVTGVHRGRGADTDIVVCSASGMAVLDIAVAHLVAAEAERAGIGQVLSR
jgi:ornithine cyclodeaminase/alanine dehydrogenase-like protein (mu-crystallin family)